jgi:hypothetical protein
MRNLKRNFIGKQNHSFLFMFCHYFISKRNNNCGDQGTAKIGEGLSKLINI